MHTPFTPPKSPKIFIREYVSSIGKMILTATEEKLTGVYFIDQKNFSKPENYEINKEHKILNETTKFLDKYFCGENVDFAIPIELDGTEFQKKVWSLLRDIPYGETVTYGQIANRLEQTSGQKVSARAIGGAVGKNKLAIILPCHRVVGSNGALTGYSGGIYRKNYLLNIEKNNVIIE